MYLGLPVPLKSGIKSISLHGANTGRTNEDKKVNNGLRYLHTSLTFAFYNAKKADTEDKGTFGNILMSLLEIYTLLSFNHPAD